MGRFDRFAAAVSQHTAKAWFFIACLLMVVVWFPTLFLMDVDTSQLIINTTTTIVTFLMVALLQNSQTRFERAVMAKLDEIIHSIDEADDRVAGIEKTMGVE